MKKFPFTTFSHHHHGHLPKTQKRHKTIESRTEDTMKTISGEKKIDDIKRESSVWDTSILCSCFKTLKC